MIVAYGNQIAMEETLAEALAKVMGSEVIVTEPEAPLPTLEGNVADLVLQADAHYQLAQECLQTGDWTCYGREMDALEQVLEALVAATKD